MKNNLFSTKEQRKSDKVSLFEAGAGLRLRRLRSVLAEKLAEITADVEVKLDEGLSSDAGKIITETLESYSHTPETEARLLSLLSYTLETQGNYKKLFGNYF
ncbi:MAG: hypothetical protein M3525_08820 [Acidobacteriota bacterium]|nr:hypothetical protein [Acidobacteriota bacterium]